MEYFVQYYFEDEKHPIYNTKTTWQFKIKHTKSYRRRKEFVKNANAIRESYVGLKDTIVNIY